jgi:acyl-CoA thioesterase FadM
MTFKSSISITTRIADLDALRHVNNRVYEQYCAEGRFRLLELAGYPLQRLLDEGLTLRPVASFVRFARQQKSSVTLQVETEAFPMPGGMILWNHQISQPDGEIACQVQAQSQTLDRHGQPVALLPEGSGEPERFLYEDIPDFSGRCTRVSSPYPVNYTDVDVLGSLPLAAFWRIFEEGRHNFGQQLGLTFEKLVKLDAHIFWVSGTYRCYEAIRPGQQLLVYTWLERIARIRAYFRQEIRSAAGATLVGASREEHLIVSLSNSRPRSLPPELATILQATIENPA